MEFVLKRTVKLNNGLTYDRYLHSEDIVLKTVVTCGNADLATRFSNRKKAKDFIKENYSLLFQYKIEKLELTSLKNKENGE